MSTVFQLSSLHLNLLCYITNICCENKCNTNTVSIETINLNFDCSVRIKLALSVVPVTSMTTFSGQGLRKLPTGHVYKQAHHLLSFSTETKSMALLSLDDEWVQPGWEPGSGLPRNHIITSLYISPWSSSQKSADWTTKTLYLKKIHINKCT